MTTLSNSPPGVRLRGARLDYGGRPLFDRLDLDLEGGAITCLLGPSGVGKSSLLRVLAGLAPEVRVEKLTCGQNQSLTGKVAYMAQGDLLLPWLDVLGNVTLGARLRGDPPDRKQARAILAQVGLADKAEARPAALSGGQRQRAALARTLMEDRPLILLDEPFSAVDALTRLRLQSLAGRMLAGRTVLLVTHDPLEALRLGDHVLVMAGRPVRLEPLPDLPGNPPRDPADEAVQSAYREILRRLEAA